MISPEVLIFFCMGINIGMLYMLYRYFNDIIDQSHSLILDKVHELVGTFNKAWPQWEAKTAKEQKAKNDALDKKLQSFKPYIDKELEKTNGIIRELHKEITKPKPDSTAYKHAMDQRMAAMEKSFGEFQSTKREILDKLAALSSACLESNRNFGSLLQRMLIVERECLGISFLEDPDKPAKVNPVKGSANSKKDNLGGTHPFER